MPNSLPIDNPRRTLDRVVICLTTGGYSGYAWIVPATVGSFVGLLLFVPLSRGPAFLQLALTGALLILGLWTSGRAEYLLKTKDPRPVVIDEITGMWISLLFVPHEVRYFLGAFFLFRFFDVLKPFPANRSQSLSGGLGIMMDDLIAGIYTNMSLRIISTLYVWVTGS